MPCPEVRSCALPRPPTTPPPTPALRALNSSPLAVAQSYLSWDLWFPGASLSSLNTHPLQQVPQIPDYRSPPLP